MYCKYAVFGVCLFLCPTDSHIYLDESGDLGWNFSAPYRNGGSSRFLTIGFLICDRKDCNYPKRLVKDIYTKSKFNIRIEKKATDLSISQKDFIAEETIKMLSNHPGMILGAITVKKERVQKHIRDDGNKIYNYMIKLAIIDEIQQHNRRNLIRDNRTVKVASGNSCIDYLQTILWFDYSSFCNIADFPTHSHMDDGIIFIDWITNIIWKHYEDGVSSSFNILAAKLKNISLYFK